MMFSRCVLVGLAFVAAGSAADSSSAPAVPALAVRPPHGARFEFGGVVGDRIEANLRHWLLTAPRANPGMTEMFRVRDREPVPELVPWAGEFVGKYLLSAIQARRMTRSDELDATIRRVIDELIAAQDANGYLGPFPKKERLLGHWDLWGHYHIMQALLMYADDTGYRPASDAACRCADLICNIYLDGSRRVFDAGSHEMNMAVIHVLGQLYRKTANDRYQRMMRHIEDDWKRAGDYYRTGLAGIDFYRTPRPRWESLHDLQGLVELYRIGGDASYRAAFLNHWRSIRELDRHNNGGFSTSEAAVGSPYRPGSIETCCTVAWMAVTLDALSLTADPVAADELEWSFLNAMLGAQHPSGRWWTYDTPMDGVRLASAHHIVFQARAGTPELNCCSVNGPRSLGMLSEWAVMLDDSGPWINYYGPCRIDLPDVRGTAMTIRQDTRYPADGRVRIAMDPQRAARFNLRLRIPSWSRATRVSVNAEPVADVRPGTYLSLEREWKPGDEIVASFDMSPRYWNGEAEVAGRASLFQGPLLLAFDQHHNPYDAGKVPIIDLARIELRSAPAQDTFPPMVLADLASADGTMVRLCDYATAGAHGTHYRSWLPAKNGRPPEFYPRQPGRETSIAPGPALFEWTGFPSRHPDAARYELLVAEEPTFASPAVHAKDLLRNRYVHPQGFEPGKMYHWKVVARSPAGSTEMAGGVQRFTVDGAMANTLKPDCYILADDGGTMIAAPLDGTGVPTRGCLEQAVAVVPAADRNGKDGGALAFDGRSSKLLYGLPHFPDDAYSFCAWVYISEFSTKTCQNVISAWCAPSDDPLRVSIMGQGVSARIEAGQVCATPPAPIERQRWTHVAAVKDGARITLYVNGQPAGTADAPVHVDSLSQSVAIGANPRFAGDEYFNGRIDDVRLFAKALTVQEIRAIATAP